MDNLNEKLEEYTDKNALHLYCQIRADGSVHMDGYFEKEHLMKLIKILDLNDYFEAKKE